MKIGKVLSLLLVLIFALSSVAAPRQKADKGSPDYINREVRHQILMQPYYTLFDWLGYKVNGNTVTLMGQVTNPALRDDVVASVKKIEGVDSVQNNIEVLPPNPNDDQIRRAVYRAIYNYDGLFKYAWGALPPIHIIVKDGRVTLMGEVDSQQDKQMAEMQAKSVPNVFAVDNQLEVQNSKTK